MLVTGLFFISLSNIPIEPVCCVGASINRAIRPIRVWLATQVDSNRLLAPMGKMDGTQKGVCYCCIQRSFLQKENNSQDGEQRAKG
jgi:hypothetical protein